MIYNSQNLSYLWIDILIVTNTEMISFLKHNKIHDKEDLDYVIQFHHY